MTARERITAEMPTATELRDWCLAICRRAGVRVHVFADGTTGLVDVPAKYVAVIDALSFALACLARGEELPELAPMPTRKGKR